MCSFFYDEEISGSLAPLSPASRGIQLQDFQYGIMLFTPCKGEHFGEALPSKGAVGKEVQCVSRGLVTVAWQSVRAITRPGLEAPRAVFF